MGNQILARGQSEHVRRSAPLLRDLNFASRALFEEFAAQTGNEIGLVTRGLLMLCKAQHSLDEEAKFAAQANALGVPAEVLDARRTAKLDPGVTMDVAGAVYFPKDAHFTPEKYLAALQRQCDQAGVKFEWTSEVSGLAVRDNKIAAVRTARGEFSADEIILCGGSWSPVIARELGLKIPIQAGKGYSLTLAQPRELPQLCSIFTEARMAITPMGSSLRFGGTMEIAGLHENINPVRVQGIIKAVPKYFPKFAAEDFSGHPAVARAAAVFAGRTAVSRPHGEIFQSHSRHRPRDDGHEPFAHHRENCQRNRQRRKIGVRFGAALAGSLRLNRIFRPLAVHRAPDAARIGVL